MNPFDYSLCDQTVTVYRKVGDRVSRQVAENAYLSAKLRTPPENYGKSLEKTFRLIIPGDFQLQPGDRVYWGVGPAEVQWRLFIPALIPQVYECAFVKPCYWEGEITHWEAGNRKEKL